MSFFVTRPPEPVPGTWDGSTPCSEAIRATTGDTNAFPLPDGCGAAEGGAAEGPGAVGAGLSAGEAASQLESEGLSVEILDLRTLIPWDKNAVLESAAKTSKVLVLHEDTRTGGFGAEIAATIAEEAFEDLDAPLKRIAAPDTPVPFSPPLEKAFIPQVDDVVAGLRELAEY